MCPSPPSVFCAISSIRNSCLIIGHAACTHVCCGHACGLDVQGANSHVCSFLVDNVRDMGTHVADSQRTSTVSDISKRVDSEQVDAVPTVDNVNTVVKVRYKGQSGLTSRHLDVTEQLA